MDFDSDFVSVVSLKVCVENVQLVWTGSQNMYELKPYESTKCIKLFIILLYNLK